MSAWAWVAVAVLGGSGALARFFVDGLISWRSEFGHHAWWSRRIGAAICESSIPFWERVTEGSLDVLGATSNSDTETTCPAS